MDKWTGNSQTASLCVFSIFSFSLGNTSNLFVCCIGLDLSIGFSWTSFTQVPYLARHPVLNGSSIVLEALVCQPEGSPLVWEQTVHVRNTYSWVLQGMGYSSFESCNIGDTNSSLVLSRFLRISGGLKSTKPKVKALAAAAVKKAFRTNVSLN